MFISFLYPFRIRDTSAPFLWIFYKQLCHFKPHEITYFGSEDYFAEPESFRERWEFNRGAQANLGYSIPSAVDLEGIDKRIISHTLFDALRDRFPTSNGAWKFLITERYEPLELALDGHISRILEKGPVDAILTWCNCRSLKVVAEKYGLKVIHNEQGPTRNPVYTQTAYFDFAGVNGHTEAQARFLKFKSETADQPIEILSKKELLYLFTKEAFLPSLQAVADILKYDIGLALQIEDDSNVIAYSKGYDNFELINCARKFFDRESVLIRRHPRGHLEYRENLGVIDDSPNVFEFFKKCRRVATVNSSVGLEAMLFDKPTYILGDSPFSFMAYNRLDPALEATEVEDQLLALNFTMFGYLIPYELLFLPDYYRWRLAGRTELEIFRYHLDYYRSREVTSPAESGDLAGRDIFIYAIENRVRNLAAGKSALEQQTAQRIAEQGAELSRLTEDLCHAVELRTELESTLQTKTVELTDMDAQLGQFAEELAYAGELRAELEKYLDHRSIEIVSRDERIKLIHKEIDLARELQAELESRLEENSVELTKRDERIRQIEEEVALERHRLEEHLRHTDVQLADKERQLQQMDLTLREREAQAVQAKTDGLQALEAELARLREEHAAIQRNCERQVSEKEQRIKDLLNSKSWKITAPLRKILDMLQKK